MRGLIGSRYEDVITWSLTYGRYGTRTHASYHVEASTMVPMVRRKAVSSATRLCGASGTR
eukprot:3355627-Prymnesium_polylepis.1